LPGLTLSEIADVIVILSRFKRRRPDPDWVARLPLDRHADAVTWSLAECITTEVEPPLPPPAVIEGMGRLNREHLGREHDLHRLACPAQASKVTPPHLHPEVNIDPKMVVRVP